jgi:hypothetical protein
MGSCRALLAAGQDDYGCLSGPVSLGLAAPPGLLCPWDKPVLTENKSWGRHSLNMGRHPLLLVAVVVGLAAPIL